MQEASREELVMTIKRYAEEISVLKWKLAEKDAQLMGGFGAGDRHACILALGAMSQVIGMLAFLRLGQCCRRAGAMPTSVFDVQAQGQHLCLTDGH
eukprot:1148880-Pelagomonas_calceolata.AAC.3